MRMTASRVVAAAVLAGLTAGGCSAGVTHAPGANQPSVSVLVRDAKAAFTTAASVRVVGTVVENGQAVTMDVGMFRSGDLSGTIKAGPLDEKVVVAGGSSYVYVSKAFFSYLRKSEHVPGSACALMCGKYIKVPGSSFTSKFSLSVLARSFQKQVPVPAAVGQVKVTSYHGQPAYELSDGKTHVFIAEHGTHYLLGVRASDNGKHGTVSFSEWNSVPPVAAPPPGEVFNAG